MKMPKPYSPRRVVRTIHRTFVGPQGLSILSGLLLAGYWFGGEGLMLFAGIAIPGGIALVSLLRGTFGAASDSDGLTGLSTRPGLEHHLAQLMAQPRPGRGYVCAVIQIDEFDQLAADHDRAVISEIEQRTADRLRAVLRESDVAARLGPGCYAVAASNLRRADLETGIQLSARLLEAVAEPVAINAARFYVTASAGFVLPRQLVEPSAGDMIDAADCAMREARQQGRGTIRAFSAAERRPRVIPGRLTEEIGDALENGQIQAWFQPQVSTDTGAVIGLETLARWQHPKHGMIAPAEFLPALAAAGQNDRLCRLMLRQALTALNGWQQAGFDSLQVSINLGENELRDPALPDHIKWELDRQDLPPTLLCVEILETVLLPGEDDVITRNVAALADMGVSIDLDDFGTGNASIAAIRRFAIDRIKIDRSFVTKIDTDRGQQEMAAAILSMAERLGLATLAEGVETLGEHAMLAQLGCNAVQGYGIAPPMPYAETLDWIRRNEARIATVPKVGRQAI